MKRKNQNEGWNRPVQEPTCVNDDGPLDGKLYDHPAFAQIAAHRVSGSRVLFGSDFQHGNYVSIKITESQLRRSLSTDWPHGKLNPIIEVAMSEAQWAHFVSAMNIGMGTQCTLLYADGEHKPGLPTPVDRQEQFGAESRERMARAIESMEKAAAALAASGLSKVKQAEILNHMSRAQSDITNNQKFVADCFAEHMETTTQAARVEVDAYLQGAIRHIGVRNLQESGIPPLTLEMPAKPAIAQDDTQ